MDKKSYLKAVVIVHGKSELQLCQYIKHNLRLQLELVSDKKGEKSIQITSVNKLLNNSIFKSEKDFIRVYSDCISYKKNKLISPLKVFIIMDTDDCDEEKLGNFISREMFKGHWLYDKIVAIYNTPDLETVLVKSGICFKKKGSERKKEYVEIFPTDNRCNKSDRVELNEFSDNLSKCNCTNMNEFVTFCLNCCKR